MGFMLKLMLQNVPHLWNMKILPTCIISIHFSYTFFFPLINALVYCYGPDRLELIIFDFTEKKIDNHPSRLIMEFFL